ncbi:sigma-70 family RNA polymerase sigma factor [Aeromicrobium stalagmiti]|uniref:sigma-70 family RNA polymerase sigma factor n=1 Tax=Aeromicrobium stalagmiti TaxID=2738988 RepID=UPI0015686C05|nr:sigma-70 family RNA polymerase sigma factor [Aeromicrobium stalagmiti]
MSEQLSTRAESSDADLISAVRSGDTDAYGELFGRHRDAAMRMARQLVRGPDADDLVAESFIRVLSTLQDGKGPDESFRAYLLTSIRRLHIDRIRAGKRVRSTDDEAELDRAVEFVDPAEMRFEQGAAAAAFSSLPERWQLVLWHLDVEGQKPADIAPLLGMSANSVSALAYRAREGLRQAYLQGHLAPTLHESCRKTTGLLGGYVRKGLSARDTVKVEDHLDGCSRCTGLYLELAEVNSNLSGILGPALLGTAFTGYVAAAAGATAIGAGAGAVGLKLVAAQAAKLVVEPVKIAGSAIAGAGTQGVVAAAVVTSVAAAGTVAVTTDFGTTAKEQPIVSAAPRAEVPTPSPEARATAEPAPTPDPTPSVEPTIEPTIEPTVEPTAEPTPEPTPEPTSEPATEPPAATQPPPEPIVPTDYGIGAYVITNDDTLLQRRFTIPVTAATSGRAADQAVTMTMQFTRRVQFRGVVSPGWDCGGAVRNQRLTTLTCTTTLPAGEGTTFVAKARGLRPSGTITVTAADDPQPTNNSVAFRSAPYLLLL